MLCMTKTVSARDHVPFEREWEIGGKIERPMNTHFVRRSLTYRVRGPVGVGQAVPDGNRAAAPITFHFNANGKSVVRSNVRPDWNTHFVRRSLTYRVRGSISRSRTRDTF